MKAHDPGLERFRHGGTGVALPGAPCRAAVRAYIWRDSDGSGDSGHSGHSGGHGTPAHLNRFPAAPYCTVTWFLRGTVHDGTSAAAPVLDPIVAAGPFTRPVTTYGAGRVHAFTVVFFPDAFARLTGLAPADLADRLQPARAVLPDAWLPLLDAVVAAPGDGERMACVDAFVAERCGGDPQPAPWLQRLRAASGIDRLCERQVERRIRQATGQSLRALRGAERFEAALLSARVAAADGTLHWASLAGASGFSDQPHLGRECRRLSGTSPAQLLDRQASDESYWLYRHWR